MTKFKYLQDFGGEYIPYVQSEIKPVWDMRHPKEPFTGACVGMLLALSKTMLSTVNINPNFAKLSQQSPIPLPPKELCVKLQEEYEERPDEYAESRIGQMLEENRMDHTLREDRIQSIDSIFRLMDPTKGKNQFLLVELDWNVTSPNGSDRTLQKHFIGVIKVDDTIIFCDPNAGAAVFKNPSHFDMWLASEMKDGALAYFTGPVKQKIIVNTNVAKTNGQVRETVISLTGGKILDFTFSPRMQKQWLHEYKLFKSLLGHRLTNSLRLIY